MASAASCKRSLICSALISARPNLIAPSLPLAKSAVRESAAESPAACQRSAPSRASSDAWLNAARAAPRWSCNAGTLCFAFKRAENPVACWLTAASFSETAPVCACRPSLPILASRVPTFISPRGPLAVPATSELLPVISTANRPCPDIMLSCSSTLCKRSMLMSCSFTPIWMSNRSVLVFRPIST